MRLLLGFDAAVAEFVAQRIPQVGQGVLFGPCSAIGVVDARNVLVAGVVFHGYMPACRSIDASFAADTPRWLTRSLASGIMAYPFTQLGVGRVTTLTPKRNRRARDFVERFGFKREGLLRKGFGDDDAVVSGLMAHEWKASPFNLQGSRSLNPSRSAAILH